MAERGKAFGWGLVAAAATLLPIAASARDQRDHVCADAEAPIDVMPAPSAVMPLTTAPKTPTTASVESERTSATPAPPVLVAGCLPEAIALEPISLAGATSATALADDPESRAAVFRFRSPDERDARIRQWIAEAVGDDRPIARTMRFYLGDWAQSSYPLPSGDQIHVMHREDATSGRICLVVARTTREPHALPRLNNWCMDRLDLWRN